MKKILVPTDFSANSKAGLRFAIQWAIQQRSELIFIHIINVIKLTRWTDTYIQKYISQELILTKERLEKFVSRIYKSRGIKPGKYTCIVKQGISADLEIMDYCRKNPGMDFICISTRGAGKFKKILGTNTGNLITKSPVPVMTVPKNYKTAPIRNMLYATDFRNYTREVSKVLAFIKPLRAPLEVLHFAWPDEAFFDKETFEKVLKKQFRYNLKLHIEKTDATHSLVQNLQNQIRISKPSVVIMFTDQDRTLFQRIFLSSKAEELSFQIKVPLLVFNKRH